MKKLKILILIILICLLSSCTSASNTSENRQPEVPKIVIVMEKTTETLKDTSIVVDKINEYIRPLISAEIDIIYIESSAYSKTLNYMYSADEQADIIFSASLGAVKQYQSDGKLLPLDQLMDQYGDGILENINSDELSIGEIDSELYGITTNRNKGYVYGMQYRKDIAEEYDIDLSDIEKLEDLTPIFEKLKKSNPEMFPYIPSSYSRTWDCLSSDYSSLGVLMNYGQTTEVVNLYGTQEYSDYLNIMYEWNQAGYILDINSNYSNDYHYYFRSDNVFCRLDTNSPEMVERESNILGKPIGYVELSPAFTSTIDLTYAMWSISTSCEYPDKAMQFLNLMYSDPVVANMLINGIEGEHYEFVDEEKGIIAYHEEIDSENSGYYFYNGWKFGNQFITYVWDGNSPEIWEETKQYNENSLKSMAFGFLFDSSKVEQEYVACMSVRDEYIGGLESGALDPEIYLPKLLEELDKAGIDTVIAEKQRQLDEWLNEKNAKEAD